MRGRAGNRPRRTGRSPAWSAAISLVAALAPCGAGASAPTPTPGPAARAGKALDHALTAVEESVSTALLVTKIRIALLQHLKDDALHITIALKDGAVELSGQVATRANQELARQVALSVNGVREVRNRITVTEGAPGEAPVAKVVGKVEREVADGLLEARVKAKLLEEVGKVAFDVEVEATDGVVSLSGTVPDASRRELAVAAARRTKGVKELHDLLKIKE